MKFYVASAITNIDEVKQIFERLRSLGHTVTADWTLTDRIPEETRNSKKTFVGAIAKRDFEGIRECDVFVLISKPEEGRSMYVELGIALTMRDATGRPAVYTVGELNNESVFYYHPFVTRMENWDNLLEDVKMLNSVDVPSKSHEGRLEEYRALREEMLEIIKERVWGQATYAALSAGVFALMKDSGKEPVLVFTIALSIPFLFHTMQREHARIRMGNYLRMVVEPNIPGMCWEQYLALWRGRFGRNERGGWLNMVDRLKHIMGFAGLFLFIPTFCWVYLYMGTSGFAPRAWATVFLALNIFMFGRFIKLYDRGQAEFEELTRVGPKG